MIAEQIYNGATAEEIGISDIEYESRKETLDAFLADEEVFSVGGFLTWLQEYNPMPSSVPAAQLPSKADMAKNVAMSIKAAVKSGFKFVPEEVSSKRHLICKTDKCGAYNEEHDRCMKCGCFLKYKTKLEAWHCPVNFW